MPNKVEPDNCASHTCRLMERNAPCLLHKTGNQFLKFTKIISITLLCFFILGCTGYKSYNLSAGSNWSQRHQQENTPIQVDEFVKIQTTDGKEFFGFINSVTEQGFKLNDQQIDYSSVKTVQVREFLWTPTLTIAAISAFTVLLLSIEPGNFSTD